MKASLTVDNFAEIAAAFDSLVKTQPAAIARVAVKTGLNVIAAEMRLELDSRVKHLQSEIGVRYVRQTNSNIVGGKVGVGVGKRSGQIVQLQRAGRPGIGIHPFNFNWWVLGSFKSGQRFTRKTRANRGVLKPQQPDFAQRASARARNTMKTAMAKAVTQYVRKLTK